VSLTALTERVHSDGAIPPGRKYFLLMNEPQEDGQGESRAQEEVRVERRMGDSHLVEEERE